MGSSGGAMDLLQSQDSLTGIYKLTRDFGSVLRLNGNLISHVPQMA